MKKIFSILLIALMLVMSFGVVGAYADDNLIEKYYRAHDTCKDEALKITDDDRNSLDAQCLETASEYGIDIALLCVSSDFIETTLEDLAEEWYTDNEFGYGEKHSGFMAAYAYDTEEVAIVEFGDAKGIVDPDFMNFIKESTPTYNEKYGHWGVLYALYKNLADEIAEYFGDDPNAASEGEGTDTEGSDVSGAVGTQGSSEGYFDEDGNQVSAATLPDWYPEDPNNFVFFHDEDAPRVVDTADIFTDSEEAEMEARLGEIREEIGRDIVIFTDVSSYGMSHKVYAADFYDFNGYGCGPDREGVCLMICMDPDNRGWWCCCTGPDTMGLYTEDIANDIDDVLYEYMVDGDYAEGVSNWIENFRNLYVKGYPFAPDWMPDRNAGFVRSNNASAPRLVDNTNTLTQEEIADLTQRAKEISDMYNMDVVVNVTSSSYGMPKYEYQEKFYYYNGYGFGSDYDGLLVTFFVSSGTCYIYTEGNGAEGLTETNEDRITRICSASGADKAYTKAAKFLTVYEKMRRTGRVPHRLIYWPGTGLLGLLAGSGFGGITLGRAKKKMNTVAFAEGASEYVVPGSLKCVEVSDRFKYTSTHRTYDPLPDDDDSSSGSGGSSFSSSYSGSSGSSHSGSGRSF